MDKTKLKERIKKYKARLEMYYKAEEAILGGAQSYEIGSRKLTRADLHEIRMMIDELEKSVETLESSLAGKGRRRCVRVIPRDV